jgi:hypothetical protein
MTAPATKRDIQRLVDDRLLKAGPDVSITVELRSQGILVEGTYRGAIGRANLRNAGKLRRMSRTERRAANKRRREVRNKWFKERAASDPAFALNRRVRHAVCQSLRGGKAGRSWQTLVGYSLDELRAHLEAQFTDGMSWENAGKWHVDHRRPLSSFKITGPDCPEFRAAWALENLQPLWARDNLRKGAKWNG